MSQSYLFLVWLIFFSSLSAWLAFSAILISIVIGLVDFDLWFVYGFLATTAIAGLAGSILHSVPG